jgi:hypothetical protein
MELLQFISKELQVINCDTTKKVRALLKDYSETLYAILDPLRWQIKALPTIDVFGIYFRPRLPLHFITISCRLASLQRATTADEAALEGQYQSLRNDGIIEGQLDVLWCSLSNTWSKVRRKSFRDI